MGDLPAITGNQLIALLKKDGWTEKRHKNPTHGVVLVRADKSGRTRIALVPAKNKSIPQPTLGAILSVKQSGITRKGLEEMIERHGL